MKSCMFFSAVWSENLSEYGSVQRVRVGYTPLRPSDNPIYKSYRSMFHIANLNFSLILKKKKKTQLHFPLHKPQLEFSEHFN
jgi:hypothetical protein